MSWKPTANKNMVPDELGPPESPLYCPVRSIVVNSGSVRTRRRGWPTQVSMEMN